MTTSAAWRSSSVQWVREYHGWAVSAELAKGPAPVALLNILNKLEFAKDAFAVGAHRGVETLSEAHETIIKLWDGEWHQKLQHAFRAPPLETLEVEGSDETLEVVESGSGKRDDRDDRADASVRAAPEVEESLDDVLKFASPEAGSW